MGEAAILACRPLIGAGGYPLEWIVELFVTYFSMRRPDCAIPDFSDWRPSDSGSLYPVTMQANPGISRQRGNAMARQRLGPA